MIIGSETYERVGEKGGSMEILITRAVLVGKGRGNGAVVASCCKARVIVGRSLCGARKN